MNRRRLLTLPFALLLALAPLLRAEAPPAATPEAVGLSSERLSGCARGCSATSTRASVAGLVTLVARNGRVVHHEAFGKADVEAARPMSKDTIFRIASQSKALTSVAAMMLVEEGRLGLDRPGLALHPRVREDDRRRAASRGRRRRNAGERRPGEAARSRSATC